MVLNNFHRSERTHHHTATTLTLLQPEATSSPRPSPHSSCSHSRSRPPAHPHQTTPRPSPRPSQQQTPGSAYCSRPQPYASSPARSRNPQSCPQRTRCARVPVLGTRRECVCCSRIAGGSWFVCALRTKWSGSGGGRSPQRGGRRHRLQGERRGRSFGFGGTDGRWGGSGMNLCEGAERRSRLAGRNRSVPSEIRQCVR